MLKDIAYLEHAVDVLSRVDQMIEAEQRFTLITSIHIQGGSARELGSLAAVSEDGEMFGYLSNGCIDRDIQLQAMDALETGAPRVLHYGAGSSMLDLVLPCGGALKVLLDPAPDPDLLQVAYRGLKARQPVELTIRPPGDHAPLRLTYRPKPKMALAGRGAVFRATAEVAHAAGFEVELLSPEQGDLEVLAPLAPDRMTHLKTPNSPIDLDLDRHSAFLTLFHDHDWEPHLIQAALGTDAMFIGCMGSQRSHDLRLKFLEAMGADPLDLARIEGPIGLVPSLRHAPSIGISAVAHVIENLPPNIGVHTDAPTTTELALAQ